MQSSVGRVLHNPYNPQLILSHANLDFVVLMLRLHVQAAANLYGKCGFDRADSEGLADQADYTEGNLHTHTCSCRSVLLTSSGLQAMFAPALSRA